MIAWSIPAATLAAVLVWAAAARYALRLNGHGPSDARIVMVATLTIVALALLASSLIYPGLITADTARFFVTLARFALLVGGIAALVSWRRMA